MSVRVWARAGIQRNASYTKSEKFGQLVLRNCVVEQRVAQRGHDDQPDEQLEFGRRNFGNDPRQEEQPGARPQPQAQHKSRLQPGTQFHAG